MAKGAHAHGPAVFRVLGQDADALIFTGFHAGPATDTSVWIIDDGSILVFPVDGPASCFRIRINRAGFHAGNICAAGAYRGRADIRIEGMHMNMGKGRIAETGDLPPSGWNRMVGCRADGLAGAASRAFCIINGDKFINSNRSLCIRT